MEDQRGPIARSIRLCRVLFAAFGATRLQEFKGRIPQISFLSLLRWTGGRAPAEVNASFASLFKLSLSETREDFADLVAQTKNALILVWSFVQMSYGLCEMDFCRFLSAQILFFVHGRLCCRLLRCRIPTCLACQTAGRERLCCLRCLVLLGMPLVFFHCSGHSLRRLLTQWLRLHGLASSVCVSVGQEVGPLVQS